MTPILGKLLSLVSRKQPLYTSFSNNFLLPIFAPYQ